MEKLFGHTHTWTISLPLFVHRTRRPLKQSFKIIVMTLFTCF